MLNDLNDDCDIISMTACSSGSVLEESRVSGLVQQRQLHLLVPATMAMSCSSQREDSKSISKTFGSPLDTEI